MFRKNGRSTKKSCKKLTSALLSAAMTAALCAGMLPQTSNTVSAVERVKNLQLGPEVLAPVMTNVKDIYDFDQKNRVTTAQTVYFGTSGTQSWYVIGYNGMGATNIANTVTLLATNNLATGLKYDNDGTSNSYVDSDIKGVVDGYYNSLFTADEKNVIVPRTLLQGAYSESPDSFCDGISDDTQLSEKIWLLTTKEADLVGAIYREYNDYWWLCSPGLNDSCAAFVTPYGQLFYAGIFVDDLKGIRPAVNINLSSVIFTSTAEGGKSSGTTGAGALTPVGTYDGSEWKLTIHDSSRDNFSVSYEGTGTIAPGYDLDFSYSNAATGTNEYISALLFDSSNNLISYGRIVDLSGSSASASGAASVTIPDDLTIGSTYTLKFISEQCNGDKKTDYSSDLTVANSITFTTVKKNPEASDFVVTLPSNTVYDGTPKTVSASGITGMGTITVKYYDTNDNLLSSAPVQAGTYTVKLDVAEGTRYFDATGITNASWTYTITRNSYNVTVTNDGHGTASASPSNSISGEIITLTATPVDGYRFKEWQLIDGNVTITNNQFTMPESTVTVKALFDEIPPEHINPYAEYGLDDQYVPENYEDNSGSAMIIEGKNLSWNDSNGKSYWYENGIKQGTYYDSHGVMGDGTIRGREIYDAESDGWYWLDACYDGAKAVGKEVWIPYIYQQEGEWDEARMREIANESDAGMADLVFQFLKDGRGKWVRYDEHGAMLKGWVKIEGELAVLYPDQAGNVYYYDHRTGLMAKGEVTLDGVTYRFDEITGVLIP